jgi:hypothetical protein
MSLRELSLTEYYFDWFNETEYEYVNEALLYYCSLVNLIVSLRQVICRNVIRLRLSLYFARLYKKYMEHNFCPTLY